MALLASHRAQQGWTRWQITRHFWLRGLLLIALQFLVINRAWELSPAWVVETYVGVLCALGGTMILGSLLLWLPKLVLIPVTLVLLIGTEMLVPDPGMWGQLAIHNPIDYLNPLLLHAGGMNSAAFWSNYPILPWLELVVFGILLGRALLADQKRAYKIFGWLGLICLTVFAAIRFSGGFGNIRPAAGSTWIDFFNLVKYPPSIAFTLLTTDTNLLLLYLFENMHSGG